MPPFPQRSPSWCTRPARRRLATSQRGRSAASFSRWPTSSLWPVISKGSTLNQLREIAPSPVASDPPGCDPILRLAGAWVSSTTSPEAQAGPPIGEVDARRDDRPGRSADPARGPRTPTRPAPSSRAQGDQAAVELERRAGGSVLGGDFEPFGSDRRQPRRAGGESARAPPSHCIGWRKLHRGPARSTGGGCPARPPSRSRRPGRSDAQPGSVSNSTAASRVFVLPKRLDEPGEVVIARAPTPRCSSRGRRDDHGPAPPRPLREAGTRSEHQVEVLEIRGELGGGT